MSTSSISTQSTVSEPASPRTAILRAAIVIVIVAALAVYLAAVTGFGLSRDRRVDLIDVALIAVVALLCFVLLQPAVFARIRSVEMKGFKVELLEKVREQQLRQANELDDLRLIIPVLFPEPERLHLRNLAQGKTSAYRGSESVRSELRRLRTAGLIRMRGNRYMSELKDDMVADLREFV